jgi:hypothetical protein
MAQIIPVFRVFDYDKAISFYIDWLGFKINWEHKPHGSPFYIQISMGDMKLDLSEHYGECSPGAKISIVDFEGLREYHRELSSKHYPYMKPGLEKSDREPGILTMTVIDPFFNRIVFSGKER